jgi:invasion protein IalB
MIRSNCDYRLALGALVAAALLFGSGVTQAQEQQPAAPAQPAQPQQQPAAPQGEGQGDQAAWVKLCEKGEQTENKQVCLTHHERLDGNTGMVLVAAAVRKIEGVEQEQLLVTLPTAISLAIPAGVQIRIDEGEPIALQYSLCYLTGCQAEIELTKELADSMRKGTQMVVAAMNVQRKAIGFPVPLTGFTKAYDGPPVDTEQYQQARQQLMQVIQQRQRELASKAAQAAEGQDGQQQAPAQQQPPAAQPAPAQ